MRCIYLGKNLLEGANKVKYEDKSNKLVHLHI